ncbi:MAG: hypothetical protein JSS65_00155 [Armatimonadetes bacterium]|nr:hypothetical protein [Armatimonadota bacterium]
MKNLIKTVFVASLCVVAALSMAQQGAPKQGAGARGGAPAFSQQQMDKMMAQYREAHKKAIASVGLSADQKKKVDAADAKHMNKLMNMQKELAKGMSNPNARNDPNFQKSVKSMGDEAKAYQTDLKSAMGEAKFKAYEEAMKKEMQKVMGANATKGKG